MKRIEVILKPFKIEEAKDALLEMEVNGLTVSEVKGYGRQRGHAEIYRGAEYLLDFVAKGKLELVVPDDAVEAVSAVLVECCRTGQIGDGKLFVTPIDDAVRIRTGEVGDAALST